MLKFRWSAALVAAVLLGATDAQAGSNPYLPSDPSKPVRIDQSKTFPDVEPAATLTPVTSAGSLTTASASDVIVTRDVVHVTDSTGQDRGYARPREQPGDLVIGNLKAGATFDWFQTSGSWAGGFGWGSLNGCGWITAMNLSIGSGYPSTRCNNGQTISLPRSAITYYWNGRSNCTSDGCDGARTLTNCSTIPEVGNVHPWTNPTTTGDTIRTVTNGFADTDAAGHHGYALYWRYVTNDYQWIMARDPHIPSTDGNWVFVPAFCFTYGLPNGTTDLS